jgi:hypothetical protein
MSVRGGAWMCVVLWLPLVTGCWQFNETRKPVSADVVGHRLALREEVQVCDSQAFFGSTYMGPTSPSSRASWAGFEFDLDPEVLAVLPPGTELRVVLVRRSWDVENGTKWFVFCRIVPEGRVEDDVRMPHDYFHFPTRDGDRIQVNPEKLDVLDQELAAPLP